jgi:hypothetical protein
VDDGNEPVEDDELLYRRVPEAWYDPATGRLDEQAFAPHKTNDITGLSHSREKYKTIEEAARGRAGKRYYVAVLKARDLRANGIAVEPRPQPGDPGHVELPDLNAGRAKEQRVLELQRVLLQMPLSVDGPFEPS